MFASRTRFAFIGALATILSASAAETERPAPASESRTSLLTIDTPIVELLLDATTRPLVEKHLPKLAERLLSDADALELLGASSPRELAIDPHVRGITDEKLKQLQADLDAAQK